MRELLTASQGGVNNAVLDRPTASACQQDLKSSCSYFCGEFAVKGKVGEILPCLNKCFWFHLLLQIEDEPAHLRTNRRR